jgi:hypothetical protein
MNRISLVTVLAMLLLPAIVVSQGEITVEEYIDTYKAIAIQEMEKHHIPASITLAQGILESGCGNSELAKQANNHFGIKCHDGWTGKTYQQDDEEKNECFRKYKDAEESYMDHSYFLTTRDRYNFLFELDVTDYKGWAYGLKQAGYATNPRYPEMLIRIIEENGLTELDEVGSRQLAVSSHKRSDSPDNPEPGARNPEYNCAPTSFEIIGRGGNDRVIFRNNGVKFILAREGDNPSMIAAEFQIYTWQIRRYNELTRDGKLLPGQKVYLERKKSQSPIAGHMVEAGESLLSISQDYGVRLKSLSRKNELSYNAELKEGQKVLLH